MKTLTNITTPNYIFNHLIYDNATDKYFAKHSHALYEMVYIKKGEVDYIIEDRFYRAKSHSLIFIKPYTYHYFKIISHNDYEKIGILFSPSYLKIDCSIINDKIELLNLNNYPIIDSIFQKLDFYQSNFPQKTFLELYFLLIKEIIFNLSLVKKVSILPQYHTPILSPILEYINNNLFSINRLEDISQALNISTSYLKAVFKNELKIQPKKYINEKKLLNARQLILSGKKASMVCDLCGFQNYSTFYRQYHNYFGISPSEDISLSPNNTNNNV